MSKLSKFNVMHQNMTALAPMLADNEYKSRRPQMCWKCQQDKPLKGGKMKFFGGGLRRFICKSCVDEKQKATTNQPQPPTKGNDDGIQP